MGGRRPYYAQGTNRTSWGAAQADGTMYVALPDTQVYNRCLTIYRSDDRGARWMLDRSITGKMVFQKCKPVLGQDDSVILFAHSGPNLISWNLRTTSILFLGRSANILDFDVCVSRIGSVYPVIDNVDNDVIGRFGSTDNGK